MKKYYKVYRKTNFQNEGKEAMRRLESDQCNGDGGYYTYLRDRCIGIVDSEMLGQIGPYLQSCGFVESLSGDDVYYARWVRSIGGRMHPRNDSVSPEDDFFFERIDWPYGLELAELDNRELLDLNVLGVCYELRQECFSSIESFAKLIIKLPSCCFEEEPGWWFSLDRLVCVGGQYAIKQP